MSPSPQIDIYEHVFYKRLILLSSLHFLDREEYHRLNRLRGRSQPSRNEARNLTETARVNRDEDIELRTFLDRMAEICASTHCGGTITAVTVHLPKGRSICPEYLILSNQRSYQDMKRVKAHIEVILKAFRRINESNCIPKQRKDVLKTYSGVLRKVLAFNRGRLNVYQKAVLDCLQELYNNTDLDDIEVQKLLERSTKLGLLECVERLRSTVRSISIQRPHSKHSQFRQPGTYHRSDRLEKDQRHEFVRLSLSLLSTLESERNEGPFGLFDLLETLVDKGKQLEGEIGLCKSASENKHLVTCHKLRHALMRILSYNDAVENFAATAIRWPNLFKDVAVRFLPSIGPKPYRFYNFAGLRTQKVLHKLGFYNRVIKNATKRWPGLDAKLNKCVPDVVTDRGVHAEIQLWSHIKGNLPEFFPFHPDRPHPDKASSSHRVVIGVSKLTCRLCHWFFQGAERHQLVVIRSSSLNVYHRWALPSLLSARGIPKELCSEVDFELSRILRSRGKIHRTETDTDSQPNSPSFSTSSDESSHDTSDHHDSEVWSDAEQGTSSTESSPDLEKPGR